jgi:release factor glutamine methyltransferase
MDEVYEPQEDSFLLEKYVKKFAKGLTLDMGTGSGIQAKAASGNSSFVIAVDINQKSLIYCNSSLKSENILLLKSNLFSFFYKKYILIKKGQFKGYKDMTKKKNKFDTIIFNPPYLPNNKKDKDVSLDGGKRGFELIENFIIQSKIFLEKNGIILLIFSSVTGKNKIDQIIAKQGYKYKLLEKKHIFFEDIYCYKINF